jgi:hypothetical protein
MAIDRIGAAHTLNAAEADHEIAKTRLAKARAAADELELRQVDRAQRLERAREWALHTPAADERLNAVQLIESILAELTDEQAAADHKVRCELGTATSLCNKATDAVVHARSRFRRAVEEASSAS